MILANMELSDNLMLIVPKENKNFIQYMAILYEKDMICRDISVGLRFLVCYQDQTHFLY